MSVVDDLALVLQSAGVGTIGTDLFAGGFGLPDIPGGDPATGIVGVLLSPASEAATRAMAAGPSAPPMEHPRVQILARALDWDTASGKADAVVAALDWYGPATVNARHYEHVEALQRPPFLLERDALNRYVFAMNFAVARAA